MEKLEAMTEKALKWSNTGSWIGYHRKVGSHVLILLNYLHMGVEQVEKALDASIYIQQWLGNTLHARAYELFLRPFKKKEVYVCCGCRGGWCEGCIPDDTLLG